PPRDEGDKRARRGGALLLLLLRLPPLVASTAGAAALALVVRFLATGRALAAPDYARDGAAPAAAVLALDLAPDAGHLAPKLHHHHTLTAWLALATAGAATASSAARKRHRGAQDEASSAGPFGPAV